MGKQLPIISGQLATNPSPILRTLLDSIPTGIEILIPVEKDGNLTDFVYIYTNNVANEKAGGDPKLGKHFLTIPGNSVSVFKELVKVVQSGSTFENLVSVELADGSHWFHEKYTKLQDTIVVSREDITNTAFKQLRNITDVTHDAVIIVDNDDVIRYWNQAATELYGFSKDEACAKKMEDIIFADKNTVELRDSIKQVRRYKKTLRGIVTKKTRKDGNVLNILTNLIALSQNTGTAVDICIIAKDISDRSHAKEKTSEDAYFIGQIVETTPDLIYIMDLNTLQLIYTNRQPAIDLGYSKEQVMQMQNPLFDIMHPDDTATVKHHISKMKALRGDEGITEVQFRLKDVKGGYKWFCDRCAVFKRNVRGTPVEKIGVCQDISARKEQEEKNQTSGDILQQVEQITGLGSWDYNIASGVFKWSEGMYTLFNLPNVVKPEPEIYYDYIPDSERGLAARIVNSIRYEHEDFEEIISLMPTGGGKKIVKVKAIISRDEKNNPVKVIGVDLDITSQVLSEQQISQLNSSVTKKNKELETLAKELKTLNSVISHDFRETLQVLYTNLEYITSTEAHNLRDSSKANIRKAQASIQKMKLLTTDINRYLQLYDIGITPSIIDPNLILRDLVSVMKGRLDQNNTRVEVFNMPRLLADPLLLSMLLTELINNSIRFRKHIGTTVIRIKYSQADELNSVRGALPNTPYGIISVSDNGIGFEDHDAEKLFDPFVCLAENNRRKGSGLGLAICKKIMTMHDGLIAAEGSVAHGATFICYFPLKQPT